LLLIYRDVQLSACVANKISPLAIRPHLYK
jgi:hypothetical protein